MPILFVEILAMKLLLLLLLLLGLELCIVDGSHVGHRHLPGSGQLDSRNVELRRWVVADASPARTIAICTKKSVINFIKVRSNTKSTKNYPAREDFSEKMCCYFCCFCVFIWLLLFKIFRNNCLNGYCIIISVKCQPFCLIVGTSFMMQPQDFLKTGIGCDLGWGTS